MVSISVPHYTSCFLLIGLQLFVYEGVSTVISYYCVRMWMHVCDGTNATACMWRPEDKIPEQDLSFHSDVGSWVLWFVPYTLSHYQPSTVGWFVPCSLSWFTFMFNSVDVFV